MNASELLGLLARALADNDADMAMPSRLCRACVELLGAQSGALTLSGISDERLTVSTSDGVSARIGDLEEMLGEGPGRLAFTEDRIVVTQIDHDRPADAAFPLFSNLAGSISGPATSYALPMRVAGRVVGVLSLYVEGDHLARELDDAQFLADAVGMALLGQIDSFDWSARSQIHQATGMVTAQLGIAPSDALAILRAHAFAHSAALGAVAHDVIGRRIVFTYDETHAVQTERSEEP